MYKVTISYETGDSENTYSAEKELGVWENTEILKTNIERLKKYTQWDYAIKYRNKRLPRPEFIVDTRHGLSIQLIADNGSEFMITPFWSDTFSSLKEVRVELVLGFIADDVLTDVLQDL